MFRNKLIIGLATAVALLIWIIPGCDDLVTERITQPIERYPTADFYPDSTWGCAGLEVTFRERSSGPIVSFTFNFGDHSDDSMVTVDSTEVKDGVTHTYDSSGFFTVTLTVTDTLGATDTETKKNCVLIDQAIADFDVSQDSGCAPLDVQFQISLVRNLTRWEWNFDTSADPPETTTYQNPYHTYNNPGTYIVRLIAYNDSCETADTMYDTIKVADCPVADFSISDTSGCTPELEVVFSNLSFGSPDTLIWNYGDGDADTTGDTIEVTHIYTTEEQADTFTVSLTVRRDGLSDTKTLENFLFIHEEPVAEFDLSDTTPVAGQAITYNGSASSGYVQNYDWSFGDGGTSEFRQGFYTYENEGTYSLRLIVSNDGCPPDTLTLEVVVSAAEE